MKRTPGPWSLIKDEWDERKGWGVQMGKAGGFMLHPDSNPEANAAFIVKACNLHDELVEALRGAKWFVDNFPANRLPNDKDFVTPMETIDRLLAKAEAAHD